jgi:hypothetical protein
MDDLDQPHHFDQWHFQLHRRRNQQRRNWQRKVLSVAKFAVIKHFKSFLFAVIVSPEARAGLSTAIATALKREPHLARHARFVGMTELNQVKSNSPLLDRVSINTLKGD